MYEIVEHDFRVIITIYDSNSIYISNNEHVSIPRLISGLETRIIMIGKQKIYYTQSKMYTKILMS